MINEMTNCCSNQLLIEFRLGNTCQYLSEKKIYWPSSISTRVLPHKPSCCLIPVSTKCWVHLRIFRVWIMSGLPYLSYMYVYSCPFLYIQILHTPKIILFFKNFNFRFDRQSQKPSLAQNKTTGRISWFITI